MKTAILIPLIDRISVVGAQAPALSRCVTELPDSNAFQGNCFHNYASLNNSNPIIKYTLHAEDWGITVMPD